MCFSQCVDLMQYGPSTSTIRFIWEISKTLKLLFVENSKELETAKAKLKIPGFSIVNIFSNKFLCFLNLQQTTLSS